MIAGFGYTLESPYLYFSRAAPFERGYDLLAIDFDYSRDRNYLAMSEEQQGSVFRADVDGVSKHLLTDTAHQKLLFIGKSLGTTAVFSLLQNREIRRRTTGVVWLTPAKERFGIFELLNGSALPGFVITGTRDEFAKDVDFGRPSACEHATHYSVQGGDHSLEAADRTATLRALERYLDLLDSFLDGL